MEHVIDPSVNYYPMYSIEFVSRKNPCNMPQAWSQFALTHSKWTARMLGLENWLRHSKDHKTRIRVL